MSGDITWYIVPLYSLVKGKTRILPPVSCSIIVYIKMCIVIFYAQHLKKFFWFFFFVTAFFFTLNPSWFSSCPFPPVMPIGHPVFMDSLFDESSRWSMLVRSHSNISWQIIIQSRWLPYCFWLHQRYWDNGSIGDSAKCLHVDNYMFKWDKKASSEF